MNDASNPKSRAWRELIFRVADAGGIATVDYMKMDCEGSELDALKGAEKSIRKWRPRVAISPYHRPEDFHAIPQWLDALNCGYTFRLDHHSIHQEETVLYARAEN